MNKKHVIEGRELPWALSLHSWCHKRKIYYPMPSLMHVEPEIGLVIPSEAVESIEENK